MINVQPYHDKLELLREWLDWYIGRENLLWLDMGILPVMSPNQIIRLFYETGVLICSGVPAARGPLFTTFKQFCDDRQTSKR